ncbi:Alpha/beta hydrolase fold-1 [Mycena sp. CBHHK59/15]|nr:Alpha/beta hydrolase fold-1 [Mycena sp. CBHHK59/15]KAJ6624695.1 Alpha/beta hydrolase fold-1 [Mycena sp. CBHHK59/15]
MASLASQSYVCDPRPKYPLVITAKRYWNPASPFLNDPDAFTLIFAHGTGFHKEHYEPTIEDLYKMLPEGSGPPKIREAWSIDCPNHGDAAVLNENTLRWGYEPIFGWQEYARSLHIFLAGLGTGVDVDFSTHRLVLLGQSMGAVSLVFALTYQPELKPDRLVLIEPMAIAESAGPAMKKFLAGGSANRRDIWPSREEAYNVLKSRPAWKIWDDRILRLYVEHGLRPLPSLEYPDKEGVTLKCTRRQETATYSDPLGSSLAYRMTGEIAKRIPIHVVYGAIDDYIPREVKDDFVKNGLGGEKNLASLSRVPKGGHLVIQTNPTGLAEAIFAVLIKQGDRQIRGKL